MSEHGAHEVEQHVLEALRTAMASAVRVGETLARIRQRSMEQVARESRERAKAYADRLDAEREAARARYRGVEEDSWWQRTSRETIASTYATATAWRGSDPEAERVAQLMEQQVKQRYGVDIDKLDQTDKVPGSEHRQAEKRTVEENAERPEPAREAETLGLLAAAEAADLAAAERQQKAASSQEPVPSVGTAPEPATTREAAAYDSPERRAAAKADMVAAGVPAGAVEAKMLVDVGNARPATDIARTQAPAAGARPGRGKGPGAGQAREHDQGISR